MVAVLDMGNLIGNKILCALLITNVSKYQFWMLSRKEESQNIGKHDRHEGLFFFSFHLIMKSLLIGNAEI